MSEYQYYEFQAIDRPLTDTELRQVRSYSTRAHITPVSFTNHYEWGDFKGNPDRWMEKYFDAFLYFSNWNARELKLRLPIRLLSLAKAKEYCSTDWASARVKDDKLILSFCDEGGDSGWDGEEEWQLSALVPVRAELANGDLRALYLGWLLAVQNDEFDNDELEPPVPPGLQELSASQSGLADFLDIDPDLLDVAAQASSPLVAPELKQKAVHSWVAQLAAAEKDDALTELVMSDDRSAAADLRRRFLQTQSPAAVETPPERRTVGALLEAADTCAEERKRKEAARRAADKARCEREEKKAREKYLASLAGHEPELWSQIDSLAATKLPKNYDTAVKLVVDLRDLGAQTNTGDFQTRLLAIRQTHLKKPSLLDRLKKAGL
jgi:hypothetical protein